jgi:hypothetical protein
MKLIQYFLIIKIFDITVKYSIEQRSAAYFDSRAELNASQTLSGQEI